MAKFDPGTRYERKKGSATYLYETQVTGRAKNLGRVDPYINKNCANSKSKLPATAGKRQTIGIKVEKVVVAENKVRDSKDHRFNPEIHVMIPNPNGKGYIQRLRSSL